MFKTKGGVKGFLNNVQKTADLVKEGTPYDINLYFQTHDDWIFQSIFLQMEVKN